MSHLYDSLVSGTGNGKLTRAEFYRALTQGKLPPPPSTSGSMTFSTNGSVPFSEVKKVKNPQLPGQKPKESWSNQPQPSQNGTKQEDMRLQQQLEKIEQQQSLQQKMLEAQQQQLLLQMQQQPQQPQQQQLPPQTQFNMLDQNHDGMLSLKEYAAQAELQSNMLKTAFLDVKEELMRLQAQSWVAGDLPTGGCQAQAAPAMPWGAYQHPDPYAAAYGAYRPGPHYGPAGPWPSPGYGALGAGEMFPGPFTPYGLGPSGMAAAGYNYY